MPALQLELIQIQAYSHHEDYVPASPERLRSNLYHIRIKMLLKSLLLPKNRSIGRLLLITVNRPTLKLRNYGIFLEKLNMCEEIERKNSCLFLIFIDYWNFVHFHGFSHHITTIAIL